MGGEEAGFGFGAGEAVHGVGAGAEEGQAQGLAEVAGCAEDEDFRHGGMGSTEGLGG